MGLQVPNSPIFMDLRPDTSVPKNQPKSILTPEHLPKLYMPDHFRTRCGDAVRWLGSVALLGKGGYKDYFTNMVESGNMPNGVGLTIPSNTQDNSNLPPPKDQGMTRNTVLLSDKHMLGARVTDLFKGNSMKYKLEDIDPLIRLLLPGDQYKKYMTPGVLVATIDRDPADMNGGNSLQRVILQTLRTSEGADKEVGTQIIFKPDSMEIVFRTNSNEEGWPISIERTIHIGIEEAGGVPPITETYTAVPKEPSGQKRQDSTLTYNFLRLGGGAVENKTRQPMNGQLLEGRNKPLYDQSIVEAINILNASATQSPS